MLKLNNISKEYNIDKTSFFALKNISVEFKTNEFVSIVGPSGCGKTTLLNIIGGLDKATNGELLINGENTKSYKDWQWDFYRNQYIGFIFQSYNLISHITVLKNVEMALTLSGVNAKERKKKAISALKKVGLENQINKLPNQLSGGQKQRVAIARAIVNEPKIILADEPTGALDSKSSVQVMELIKEISKDKLVIMVSHNKELAEKYSTRIVEMLDGNIINDKVLRKARETKTNKDSVEEVDKKITKVKNTKMSYWQALKLSFSNLRTKKGRALITSIASSIGIIGVALVLFLSNGFNSILNKYEEDVFSQMPIEISRKVMLPPDEINPNDFVDVEFTDEEVVYPERDDNNIFVTYNNNITQEYVDYINKLDSKNYTMLNYNYGMQYVIAPKNGSHIPLTDVNSIINIIPNNLEYISDNYDILYGDFAKNNNEAILVIDNKNVVSKKILTLLGFENFNEGVSFEEIVNSEFSLINYDDAYTKISENRYTLNSSLSDEVYEKNKIKITGIVRIKKDSNAYPFSSGIYIKEDVRKLYSETNGNSALTTEQKNNTEYNLLTGKKFQLVNNVNVEYENSLTLLGANKLPTSISIYPKNKETKDAVIKYLDDWNKQVENEEDKIYYSDIATTVVDMLSQMTNMSSIVLIVFASISLVVSTVMISIITYISVIERTKEIGILKSLGARKKDITRVFKAESSIIGFFAGVIGVIIAIILCIPTNSILTNVMSTLSGVMKPSLIYSIMLIVISVLLTYISALIPARIASKKNAVDALRTE